MQIHVLKKNWGLKKGIKNTQKLQFKKLTISVDGD